MSTNSGDNSHNRHDQIRDWYENLYQFTINNPNAIKNGVLSPEVRERLKRMLESAEKAAKALSNEDFIRFLNQQSFIFKEALNKKEKKENSDEKKDTHASAKKPSKKLPQALGKLKTIKPINRGGNTNRVFTPPEQLSKLSLTRQHARAFRVGFKEGYKGKKEELAKKANPMISPLITGIPTTEYGKELLKQKTAAEKITPNKRALSDAESMTRGSQYVEAEVEVEYQDRGRTPDRRNDDTGRKMGRGPTRPRQSAPSEEPVDDGNGNGGGNNGGNGGGRRPPKMPKIPRGGLGQTGADTAKLASQLARTAAMAARVGAFFATPAGWITLAVIILLIIILLIIFFAGGFEDEEAKRAQEQPATETLSVTKTGPPQAPVNQPVTFTVNLNDTVGTSEITVIDHLPEGTSTNPADIQSSWQKYTLDAAQRTITWKASENLPPNSLMTPPIALSFTVTLKPTIDNIHFVNWIEANSAAGHFGGQNIPESQNDCFGVYRRWMDQLKRINRGNYGDPNCELIKDDPNGKKIIDKDMMLNFLKDPINGPGLSPTEAEGVFLCIMPKECGGDYDPNAWNPKSTSSKDGTPGAFGCFQMNAQGFSNPGQPEDVGDVVWQMQIINANNWRNNHKQGKWRDYWPESYTGCLTKYGL